MNQDKRPRIDSTAGVSEIVGSMLLISLVVAGVAIVAVVLFSQSSPQEVPNVNFMTGTNSPPTFLYLYHNGGDTLTYGQFTVLVDGVSKPYTISGGGNQWSLGKNLIVPISTAPDNVALVYNVSGSGGVVIHSASANVASASGTVSPDIVAGISYPPAVDVVQLMGNVTNNTIDYYRENGTIIQPGGFLRFTVSRTNSTMYTTSASIPVPLNPGDIVTITPDSVSQGMRVFGVGDQIWELTSEKATVAISGQQVYTGPVLHSWITGYTNLRSELNLSTASSPGSYFTELAVNNYPSYERSQTFSSQIINGTSSRTVLISGAGPNTIGLFVLQFDNKSKSTYFVGSAYGYSVI
jgi:hypothetical protein